MQYCPNFNLKAYRFDPVRGWIMFRLRCKSWRCPFCAIENQKMWRKHLKEKIIDLGGSWWFGTITAPAWNRTPENTLAVIRKNFDRFVKRLKRIFKIGVEYVRIYEKHKSGSYHLHIIISGLADRVMWYTAHSGATAFKPAGEKNRAQTWHIKTWWKKTLAKVGCGYIADIKPIPAIMAIGYVTEYMTKSAQDYHVPNLRRIQTSRKIGSPGENGIEQWLVKDVIYGSDIGYRPLVDLDEKIKIPAEYWRDNVVYPPES